MRVSRLAQWGTAAVLGMTLGGPMPTAQEAQISRTILQRQDLAGAPGYELIFAEATIPVGAREGRHTHPGTMVGYLLEGTMAFEQNGTVTEYSAGKEASVVIGPGVPHEGFNRGKIPTKALVVFVVEKGKPLSPLVP